MTEIICLPLLCWIPLTGPKKKELYLKLYHTSQREIRFPDIHYGRKNADFGQGFYLTPEEEFAHRWASKDAVMNEYELDETDLFVHRFSRDAEWYDYIFHNRRGQDGLEADVVIGPIANDTIFDTMGIISSGFLTPEEALRLLLIGPEYTQVAVKSERAVERLCWTGAKRISVDSENREEIENYQKAFAEAMDAMG